MSSFLLLTWTASPWASTGDLRLVWTRPLAWLVTSRATATTESCVYPEPVDEVIASEQVVDQELERVVPSGLVECENIKRPLIHFLEQRTEWNRREEWGRRDETVFIHVVLNPNILASFSSVLILRLVLLEHSLHFFNALINNYILNMFPIN